MIHLGGPPPLSSLLPFNLSSERYISLCNPASLLPTVSQAEKNLPFSPLFLEQTISISGLLLFSFFGPEMEYQFLSIYYIRESVVSTCLRAALRKVPLPEWCHFSSLTFRGVLSQTPILFLPLSSDRPLCTQTSAREGGEWGALSGGKGGQQPSIVLSLLTKHIG